MKFNAKTVADFLKGEIEGDPDAVVSNIAKIEEGKPGDLSFLANPKYEQYLYTTKSSIVLVNKSFIPGTKVNATLIRVDNAYDAFASLLQLVVQSRPGKKGIHPTAVIEPSSSIGKDVYIGAYAYIGENCIIGERVSLFPHVYVGDNTVIGNDTVLNPGVKVYHECRIGQKCVIHAGTVIGSDGFGFAPQAEDEFLKIPQIGNVIIEDNVEIGSNVAIDRATMGSTIIRKGVKSDNLIQIGHNVEIGENTVMAGQVGIAGSTKIGRNCMFGGQVGIAGHLKIADGTKIGAQSGIPGDVKKENSVLLGYPAIDHRDFFRSSILFRRLPEINSKIERMAKDIDLLKKNIETDK